MAQDCETSAVSLSRLLNYSDEALARDRGGADRSPALAARCPRPVRRVAPARRPSPVVRRVPRRHQGRSPLARHPPGDSRRSPRPHRRAERSRHRTRPLAGGNRPVPRPVRRAARDVEVCRDRPARCSHATTSCSNKSAPATASPPSLIVAHLGLRVELRPVQRHPADRRRARDARVGSAPLGVLPRASCSTPSTSSTAATSSSRELKGSWAGAMGQVQFMPSSYLKFAEDFDGDGRRDIWSTPSDIFASIANYMKGHGWVDGDSVGPRGRRVRRRRAAGSRTRSESRNGTCRATRDMTVALPAPRWQELGVRTPRATRCPAALPDAALVTGTVARVPRAPQLRRAARIQLLARLRHQRGPARRPHRRRRPGVAAGEGEGEQGDPPANRRRKPRYDGSRHRRSRRHRSLPVVRPEKPPRLLPAERHDAVRPLQDRPARRSPCRSTSRAPPTSTASSRRRRFRSSWTSGRRGAARAGWWRPKSRKSPHARPGGCSSSRSTPTPWTASASVSRIMSIPTMAVFRGGREIARTTGARPAADIESVRGGSARRPTAARTWLAPDESSSCCSWRAGRSCSSCGRCARTSSARRSCI